MIKTKGRITHIKCDGIECNKFEICGRDKFKNMWYDVLKKRGWYSKKIDDKWHNFCPSCHIVVWNN